MDTIADLTHAGQAGIANGHNRQQRQTDTGNAKPRRAHQTSVPEACPMEAGKIRLPAPKNSAKSIRPIGINRVRESDCMNTPYIYQLFVMKECREPPRYANANPRLRVLSSENRSTETYSTRGRLSVLCDLLPNMRSQCLKACARS